MSQNKISKFYTFMLITGLSLFFIGLFFASLPVCPNLGVCIFGIFPAIFGFAGLLEF
jgi:hypothetical protein